MLAILRIKVGGLWYQYFVALRSNKIVTVLHIYASCVYLVFIEYLVTTNTIITNFYLLTVIKL